MIIFYWFCWPQGVTYRTWAKISFMERLPGDNHYTVISMSGHDKITIPASYVIAIVGSDGFESILP